MGGIHLEFFVHEGERHHGALMSDWLLGEAQRIGIAGGSAFRAVAGYGRHGVMHEQHFYELAGNLPVQVVFLTSRELAERLLKRLADEKLKLVYSISETEYGVTGRD
jgi:uncharacterized protein